MKTKNPSKRSRVPSGYEEIKNRGVCVYCGCPKEVWDHALPYSKKDLPQAQNRVLVPACAECNGLLSDSVQHTLGDRIIAAKSRLRNRYRKVVSMPDWSNAELAALEGGNLAGVVTKGLKAKKFIQNRLDFDYFVWVDAGSPLSLLP